MPDARLPRPGPVPSRLAYPRFGAAGGDIGSHVSRYLGRGWSARRTSCA